MSAYEIRALAIAYHHTRDHRFIRGLSAADQHRFWVALRDLRREALS